MVTKKRAIRTLGVVFALLAQVIIGILVFVNLDRLQDAVAVFRQSSHILGMIASLVLWLLVLVSAIMTRKRWLIFLLALCSLTQGVLLRDTLVALGPMAFVLLVILVVEALLVDILVYENRDDRKLTKLVRLQRPSASDQPTGFRTGVNPNQ